MAQLAQSTPSLTVVGWKRQTFLAGLKACLFHQSHTFLSLVQLFYLLMARDHILGYKLVKYAMEKDVIIMCLPPHTSHVLQPLDISCYGLLKQAWRSAIKAHSMATGALHITKELFPALILTTWENGLLPQHLRSGFRAAGLHPLSKTSVPECKIAPSLESAVEDHPTVMIQSPHLPHIKSTHKVQCLCTHKYPHLTPLRLHLRGHFSEILIKKDQHPSSKDKTKINPSYYGQALTTDEIAELLLSRDEAKEAKKKAKTNSKLLYILHTNQALS